ncbi:replication/maintenance protein RepL [Photobacterium carnosum]|uniref:Plasmid replication protein RepL domain-containing protein n=1 Tax=Photobacterium carnosum TaxID=2023717 RepID=A0A2N4ULV3_9GAMM|nr:replication/maintenance protein RepL [Photobacterium carnosum]PLC55999.1 hypothetical protein CIK00_20790 [Photobacterium carnosum]
MKKGTTTKKTKIVGTQNFINQKTGEIVELNVVEASSTDFNFEKIWLGHIMQALDCLGSQRIKVVTWLLENKDNDNRIIARQADIAEGANVSKQTVTDVISTLISNDILKMVHRGVYLLNPNVIFKGHHGKRMDVLIRYNKL